MPPFLWVNCYAVKKQSYTVVKIVTHLNINCNNWLISLPKGTIRCVVYHTYILRCSDNTLYIGCTNDLKKRLHAHNHAKSGAHYTKIRRPVVLVWSEVYRTLAKGRAREAELKRLTRKQKLAIIAG